MTIEHKYRDVISAWFDATTEDEIQAAAGSVVAELKKIQEKSSSDWAKVKLWKRVQRDLELKHLRAFKKDFNCDYSAVESFVLFLSPGSSGHSLIGSILDAHPECTISHEVDVLELLAASPLPIWFTEFWPALSKRPSRVDLFNLISLNSYQMAKIGRYWNDHSYSLPQQSQGICDRIRVIGDKRGAPAAKALAENPKTLGNLQKWAGVPLKVITVTRNPYDTLGSAIQRFGNSIQSRIEYFRSTCVGISVALDALPPSSVHHVRHEELSADSAKCIRSVLEFLKLSEPTAYASDCGLLVWSEPEKKRFAIDWSNAEKAAVQSVIDDFWFLKGYKFED